MTFEHLQLPETGLPAIYFLSEIAGVFEQSP